MWEACEALQLVRPQPDQRIVCTSLGEQRLKGITDPVVMLSCNLATPCEALEDAGGPIEHSTASREMAAYLAPAGVESTRGEIRAGPVPETPSANNSGRSRRGNMVVFSRPPALPSVTPPSPRLVLTRNRRKSESGRYDGRTSEAVDGPLLAVCARSASGTSPRTSTFLFEVQPDMADIDVLME